MFAALISFFLLLIPGSQGFESSSRVYAQEGMSMVQLPSIACKTTPLGTKGPANVEFMWAKEEKDNGNTNGKQWRMIIAGNKDGTTQTFNQPILGWHEMANTSQKNVDFYGRVNITTGCDLVIQNVRKEDEGLYLSVFKIVKTNGSEHGDSTVELVVLGDSRANKEVDDDKKADRNVTGPGTNITAEHNALPDNTTYRNNNKTVNSDGGCWKWIALSFVLGIIILPRIFALGYMYFVYRRNSSPKQVGATNPPLVGNDDPDNGNVASQKENTNVATVLCNRMQTIIDENRDNRELSSIFKRYFD